MFRNLTLFLFLTVCAFTLSKTSFATLITVNGGSAPYSLNNGDTLYIASGIYTGAVSGLNSNNKTIIVADGATFNPSTLNPTNGVVCRMIIYGTFTYAASFTTNTNFTLDIYAGGIVNLADMNTKGRDQVWTNQIGGMLSFTGNVLINGGTASDENNVFNNYETVTVTGNFQMNSGSAFYNYKDFDITGNFRVNGGTFENTGKMDVTGNILMNNGASVIRNYCGITATAGINNTSGNFYNYSFIWAINSDLTNSANIINGVFNHSTPMIRANNFTLSTGGNITGPCRMYFDLTTTHTGGTIGVAGVTSDTIRVYDVTRTQPTQIFDVQSGGTRHPNVIYNAWGAPDTTYQWSWGCSFVYLMDVPLAVNWNYFYVYLSDKTPLLNWSADYDEGTIFEIQRSYDGRNFTNIRQVASEVGRSQYAYNDMSVNTNAAIVYYRIMAIEPNGSAKFTQIRNVRFSNKPGTLHIYPNPFVSNFVIDYNAKEKQELVIKIFNTAGQQKLAKKVSVHDGTNRIEIKEVANFSKGIYIVQVSDGTSIITSGKIIKQ